MLNIEASKNDIKNYFYICSLLKVAEWSNEIGYIISQQLLNNLGVRIPPSKKEILKEIEELQGFLFLVLRNYWITKKK